MKLPIKDILSDDEFNSRGAFTLDSVLDLSESMKNVGQIQPIVVQPWKSKPYRIVCGHRRFAAAQALGWTEIDAIVDPTLTEEMALFINVSENIQRRNLNILQEAKALGRFGWDARKLAREFRVRPEWVQVRLDLLNLPEEIQNRAAAGYLTQHQISEIAALHSVEAQMELTRKCVDHKIRGERGSLKVKKQGSRPATGAQCRPREDVFAMQARIQEATGQNSHPMARALAWAAGIIPDDDLIGDVEAMGFKVRRD